MRPKTKKNICCCPIIKHFKPCDCHTKNGEINLTREEIEALNLKNIEKLDQIEAAKKMGTSQSTFQRILNSAYQKVSDALVNGKEVKIEK